MRKTTETTKEKEMKRERSSEREKDGRKGPRNNHNAEKNPRWLAEDARARRGEERRRELAVAAARERNAGNERTHTDEDESPGNKVKDSNPD